MTASLPRTVEERGRYEKGDRWIFAAKASRRRLCNRLRWKPGDSAFSTDGAALRSDKWGQYPFPVNSDRTHKTNAGRKGERFILRLKQANAVPRALQLGDGCATGCVGNGENRHSQQMGQS